EPRPVRRGVPRCRPEAPLRGRLLRAAGAGRLPGEPGAVVLRPAAAPARGGAPAARPEELRQALAGDHPAEPAAGPGGARPPGADRLPAAPRADAVPEPL